MLLHEATSALDNEAEHWAIEALKSLDRNVTVIMVAQRISSLRHCNKIVQLDDSGVAGVTTYSKNFTSQDALKLSITGRRVLLIIIRNIIHLG